MSIGKTRWISWAFLQGALSVFAKHPKQYGIPFPEMMVERCSDMQHDQTKNRIGEGRVDIRPYFFGTVGTREWKIGDDVEVEQKRRNIERGNRRDGPPCERHGKCQHEQTSMNDARSNALDRVQLCNWRDRHREAPMQATN